MQDQCDECGFDESAAEAAKVADALSLLALEIVQAVRATPKEILRQRPAAHVWSAQEYLGHLREAMAFHRFIIEKGLAEHEPVIPLADPEPVVEQANYHSSSVEDLIGQFHRRVDRLCTLLLTLDIEAVGRTVVLGDRRIALALVARSAWHECHHHLGDINRAGLWCQRDD
jgi:hypothetical protein